MCSKIAASLFPDCILLMKLYSGTSPSLSNHQYPNSGWFVCGGKCFGFSYQTKCFHIRFVYPLWHSFPLECHDADPLLWNKSMALERYAFCLQACLKTPSLFILFGIKGFESADLLHETTAFLPAYPQ